MLPYNEFRDMMANGSIGYLPYMPGPRRIHSADGIIFDADITPLTSVGHILKQDSFNLSMQCKISGTVFALGVEVPTHMWKHFPIVRNGIPCTSTMYFKVLSGEVPTYFRPLDTSSGVYILDTACIDFSSLYKEATLQEYVDAAVDAIEAGMDLKILKSIFPEYYKRAQKALPVCALSPEQLESIGVGVDGFKPKGKSKGSEVSRIKVNVRSFSSIPPVERTASKILNGEKMTPSETLMMDRWGNLKIVTDPTDIDSAATSRLAAAKELMRGTNYSIIYQGYRFGQDIGTPFFTGKVDRINGIDVDVQIIDHE